MRQVLDVMAIIGIPSLFTMVVFMLKKLFSLGKKMAILMDAQQKQMRRDLTLDYHKYMAAGQIDDDDLDMWEQAYQAYHALGENGIMDARRQDLIHLNSQSVKAG
ncbi:MAG: hypothetical protein IKT30_06925 [Bacteroidaceae bacterium]|nr:hypothetical protein [Bacteroidaceae bacterium]